MFRSNNEVYKGYQLIQGLNLPNIRIRIQGSLPCEFTRLRECFELIEWLKTKTEINKRSLLTEIRSKINELIIQFPNWNHFYLRVTHAIVLDYFEQNEERPSIENLIEFIEELSSKDDGQLFKIYEKNLAEVANNTLDTEIVLTTMHKVKGLEFEAVVIVPSITSLGDGGRNFGDELDEERRLAFVSYTRAQYRLMIFLGKREVALAQGQPFEQENQIARLPVEPGLRKHILSTNARDYTFTNKKVNEYIRQHVKCGDLVSIITATHGAFTFKNLIHNNIVVGNVSHDAIPNLNTIASVKNFVINEVTVWTYNATIRSDKKNNTFYQNDWCPQAKEQGFIYIVDFAGFGIV